MTSQQILSNWTSRARLAAATALIPGVGPFDTTKTRSRPSFADSTDRSPQVGQDRGRFVRGWKVSNALLEKIIRNLRFNGFSKRLLDVAA
jgi:hypothetical protein